MRDGPLAPLTSEPIPAAFIPCVIPNHLGPNFTNHIDFTRNVRKRYWILYAPADVAGLYSLKQTCFNVAGDFRCTEEAFAWFHGWRDAWTAWARHCYERHEKCATHPHACAAGACPAHPEPENPEAIVIPDVKQEPRLSTIKREVTSTAGGSASGPGTSRVFVRKTARRKTTALESDSEDDAGGYRAPLYDPDTPPEKSKTKRLVPSDVGNSDVGVVFVRVGCLAQRGTVGAQALGQHGSSRSTRTTQHRVHLAPVARGGKGKGKTTAASKIRRDDTFFVGSSGAIHHSKEAAFNEISRGPVQVVLGWDEATDVAQAIREAMDIDG
ncbi:hypothetical protein C8F04DRAFT_1276128 [Mycena alexandri]|uniref:Uncharacterized protein n=1 Tax=Mycena alexandri TaxID=1745969 RepID=A0AAD6S2A7_9AGAR|nr:hypothetical protein C8F04DRAFT_1276128 [Mycena alexandri]